MEIGRSRQHAAMSAFRVSCPKADCPVTTPKRTFVRGELALTLSPFADWDLAVISCRLFSKFSERLNPQFQGAVDDRL